MEFPTIHTANRIDHQMIMDVSGIYVCSDHNLEVWEFFFRKLQSDGVGLYWSELVLVREGLNKVVKLASLRLVEALFSCPKLQV